MSPHSSDSDSGRASRRSFLKVSAGAAAGAAVASTAVSGVSAASDGPVRIGVVGTGSRGSDLIRKLSTIDSCRVVAICDDYAPHLKGGQKFAGDQAKAYADYGTMLREAELDAVVVATPLYLHYAMCVEAIKAGLAVFCEKTMCYSIDEARKLKALVEERDAIFQVGLQRRANPVYDQAAAMVETGMLGTVTTIKSQWHRNDDWRRELPVEKGHPDYDALDRRLNWRLYRDRSQGLMTELGSHQMDVANRVLRTPPKRVMGMGGIDYYDDGREVFDSIFCTYEYEVADAGEGDPQTVRVTYSSIQTNAYEGVTELVMGTKGTLLITQKKALFYQEANARQELSGAGDRSDVDGMSGATLRVADDPWAHRGRPMEINSDVDDTRAELVSFVDDVRTGNRDTACTAAVGLENTATVLIANEAMRSGETVAFPEGCGATG